MGIKEYHVWQETAATEHDAANYRGIFRAEFPQEAIAMAKSQRIIAPVVAPVFEKHADLERYREGLYRQSARERMFETKQYQLDNRRQ